MCRLLETMMLVDGTIRNAEYHNARMNASRRRLFGAHAPLDVRELVAPPAGVSGMVRCRMVYADVVVSVSFEPYVQRRVASLRLVRCDDLSYSHKYEDRAPLIEALRRRGECDDILIVKGERVTDTSFSNIALFDGTRWVTPSEPLLRGTMRASLLDRGVIIEAEVRAADLHGYSRVMLINALRAYDEHDTIGIDAITTDDAIRA